MGTLRLSGLFTLILKLFGPIRPSGGWLHSSVSWTSNTEPASEVSAVIKHKLPWEHPLERKNITHGMVKTLPPKNVTPQSGNTETTPQQKPKQIILCVCVA